MLRLLLALPVEQMVVGDAYPKGTPLPIHCTLMPWFDIVSEQRAALDSMLAKVSCDTPHVRLASAGLRHDFGPPDAPVSAHTIEHIDTLMTLHTRVLLWLARRKSEPDTIEWIGAGYVPHITDVDGRAFGAERACVVDRVVMIERDPTMNTKLVVGSFRLCSC